MTDQTIPADKVRAWVTAWETTRPEHRTLEDAEGIIQALRDLLPPPTLADMTEEERHACIRMQCDTAPNGSVRGFIADIYPGGCRVIERGTWQWRSCSDDMVTPRPDLPRMEWPGDKKAADIARRITDDQARAARQAPEATNDRWGLPSHRTEAGYPNCSTCDGGGCPDCTDPA